MLLSQLINWTGMPGSWPANEAQKKKLLSNFHED